MSTPKPHNPTATKVLIVGAGIGGLILGLLLERAGIDYLILERAKKVISLGSALAFGANVMPVFEQLGIAEEVKANSKRFEEGKQFYDSLEEVGTTVFRYSKERHGHYSYVISRPVIYDIIFSKVPTEKLRMGVKVVSIEQDKDGATARDSNGQLYRGEILVGADGAHSMVRQSIYQDLSRQNCLPESDGEKLSFSTVCLVGTTNPLDPQKYPCLNSSDTYFLTVVGKKIPYSWVCFSVPGNKIAWMALRYVDKGHERSVDKENESQEWGPQATEDMCNAVRDFAFPEFSLGELIDQTPKELISKVMLEEKLFETWHHGRVVLLGDACHKMHPAAGLGAVSAVQDAVVLANRLFGLGSTSVEDLKPVFKAYHEERRPVIVNSYDTSKVMARLVGQWMWLKVLDQLFQSRPQASFIPLLVLRGKKTKTNIHSKWCSNNVHTARVAAHGAGAGLGGLTLAAILERAGIDYVVFEKAKTVVPFGSAMAISASIMPIFEQLGIAERIRQKGKPIVLRLQHGSLSYIVPRPDLYEILETLVPKEKIKYGAKILSYIQNKDGVMIRCWDNSTHHGDILVGADGAYSAVRQGLYKQLNDKRQLPESDLETLSFTSCCLIGTTNPLDPEKYTFLKKEDSYYIVVIPSDGTPFTWVYFTVDGNRVGWTVIEHLASQSSGDNDSFRTSEWGPESAEMLCKQVRDFEFPGLTLGELIDQTPKEHISKVMLEEKMFETWYSGRTVLIGDACHKMHPAAGLGAVCAIQDAAILANWMSEIKSSTTEEIEKSFKAYRDERYPVALKNFELSKTFAKLIGPSVVNTITRKLLHWTPEWLWVKILDQMTQCRPQVVFLPLIPDKGKIKPMRQPSLRLAEKYQDSSKSQAQLV
ncbi:hypothetical protein BGW38_000878 [Lunasporangiospora selenospora]|uniref:FAD-binding domain-containing protein n=1 Tax=Lunasporangiospora selenospora TaxID=979761 RepID=A0A9P6G279_9FUNG|nr:hypothetical protein BGW38_000878 [Lunasporangiospora selenospora]